MKACIIKLLMISCAQYRTSINITLTDIFADFVDSRKEALMKRVRLALEDLEIRMRNQVEGNNLANLQMLLKKQQAMKKLEEKIESITEEIEEKRQRDHFLTAKFTEMQAELTKSTQSQRYMHDKVRTLNEIIHQKDAQLSLKDQAIAAIEKQLKDRQKQSERLEQEKHKIEESLKRLRETYRHKTEQTELMMKIKDKKFEESMNESITSLHIRHQREKEKREVENKLKSPKIEKRNQRIQVGTAPSPAGSVSSPIPTTTRLKESQLTNRQPVRNFVDREVQTISTQQKKIVEFIDNTPKQAQKLQEIRLLYSATPKFLPPADPPLTEQPKITRHYIAETQTASIQTDPIAFKPPTPSRLEKTCQATSLQDKSFKQYLEKEINQMKEMYTKMEQFHDRRYWQLLRIYENRPSQDQDLKEIQLLKVTLLETQLQLAKKDREVADHRESYTKAKFELQENQNNALLKRLSVKLGEAAVIKKPRLNQTCSFFHSPKRIRTQLQQEYAEQPEEEDIGGTYYTTKIKRATDEDIITVTKSRNMLKYHRHSLKSSMVSTDGHESHQKIGKEYKKYTKLKVNNYD